MIGNKYATLINNNLTRASIYFTSFNNDDMLWTHTIPTSNTVNGKPVLYDVSTIDLIVKPATYGEVIAVNCTNVSFMNRTITSDFRILCFYGDNLTIEDNDVKLTNSASW